MNFMGKIASWKSGRE